MEIFALASSHGTWALARQSVIATNIAHANTPGYKAKDLKAFSAEVSSVNLQMQNTHPVHLGSSNPVISEASVTEDTAWDISHSGNSVSLEQELIKSGEVHRELSLNFAVVRSFHRMMLSGLRTGQ